MHVRYKFKSNFRYKVYLIIIRGVHKSKSIVSVDNISYVTLLVITKGVSLEIKKV